MLLHACVSFAHELSTWLVRWRRIVGQTTSVVDSRGSISLLMIIRFLLHLAPLRIEEFFASISGTWTQHSWLPLQCIILDRNCRWRRGLVESLSQHDRFKVFAHIRCELVLSISLRGLTLRLGLLLWSFILVFFEV